MAEGEGRERRWLRPLGLLAVVLALASNQPLVLVGVPFALLSFLVPGARIGELALGGLVFVLVFLGDPSGGLWHLERGWAILVGGSFVAVTLAWPHLTFLLRALTALVAGTVWSGVILGVFGGWNVAEGLVLGRIDSAAAGTLDLFQAIAGGPDADAAPLAAAVSQAAQVQGILFPALIALSTLAALGVAWWLHVRMSAGTDGGLAPLKSFRFPDPLIWVLIGGLTLMILAGWTDGWGRLGANLTVFMGGLYALRGMAVVLFLSGGFGLLGGVLLGVTVLLLPPLVLLGAMAVGIGDTWFDLRRRRLSRGEAGPD